LSGMHRGMPSGGIIATGMMGMLEVFEDQGVPVEELVNPGAIVLISRGPTTMEGLAG